MISNLFVLLVFIDVYFVCLYVCIAYYFLVRKGVLVAVVPVVIHFNSNYIRNIFDNYMLLI